MVSIMLETGVDTNKYELYREKRTEYRVDRHTVSGALQTF